MNMNMNMNTRRIMSILFSLLIILPIFLAIIVGIIHPSLFILRLIFISMSIDFVLALVIYLYVSRNR
jgi:hypothetical protein